MNSKCHTNFFKGKERGSRNYRLVSLTLVSGKAVECLHYIYANTQSPAHSGNRNPLGWLSLHGCPVAWLSRVPGNIWASLSLQWGGLCVALEWNETTFKAHSGHDFEHFWITPNITLPFLNVISLHAYTYPQDWGLRLWEGSSPNPNSAPTERSHGEMFFLMDKSSSCISFSVSYLPHFLRTNLHTVSLCSISSEKREACKRGFWWGQEEMQRNIFFSLPAINKPLCAIRAV